MKIIIPMTGKSTRFKKSGIQTPKQFLKIQNKYILEHIIDMFPGEKDINLLVSNEDKENLEFSNYLSHFDDLIVHNIDYQYSGPGGALLESNLLDTEDDVLINYCDFANIWNWEDFKQLIHDKKPDGIVPAYHGQHPHSIYNNDYAFIKNNGDKIKGIQEKKSFTDNKIEEYASSGTYYFKSGYLAKKYINKVFELKQFINDEVYISTPFQEMINDKLDIRLFHINYFFQWGTPEDYYEFIYNLNEVENVNSANKIDTKDINILIPAAGESSRFKAEGYNDSKINLKVNDIKVIDHILNSFSKNEKTKLLIHKDDNFKNNEFKDSQNIFIIKQRTSGQAESCLKLVEKVVDSKPILIHSADCILDKELEIDMGDNDIVLFTKNNYRRAFYQYQNYGWVNFDNDKINSFSIKQKPKDELSSVITGVFLFKNKETYINLYKKTKEKNKDLKEIHVDNLVETAFNNQLKIGVISSEKNVMLGTPLEFELFEYMYLAKEYLDKK